MLSAPLDDALFVMHRCRRSRAYARGGGGASAEAPTLSIQNVLATRNPTMLMALSGAYLSRDAERRCRELKSQEPPRTTRDGREEARTPTDFNAEKPRACCAMCFGSEP
jgi:hypothetical protein